MTTTSSPRREIALFSTPLNRSLSGADVDKAVGGWSALLVGGRHGVDRGQPAATANRSPVAVERRNGRAGTNRIGESLIDAHATRFTATNPNCRRLIDAAVPAVSAGCRRLS